VAYVSLCDELRIVTGGDGAPADGFGCVDADAEAEFAAEHLEAVDAGFGLIAEVKVFAFVELGYMQSLLQHVRGEGAG